MHSTLELHSTPSHFTSSARKLCWPGPLPALPLMPLLLLASAGSAASSKVHSTHVWVHRWMDLSGALVCCTEVPFFFFLVMNIRLLVNQRREKKETTHIPWWWHRQDLFTFTNSFQKGHNPVELKYVCSSVYSTAFPTCVKSSFLPGMCFLALSQSSAHTMLWHAIFITTSLGTAWM